jgi:DNA-binding response OmpR family regulator
LATILVADDDQLLRAIIRDHLERAGHTVLEAGDGIAAIDIALDERPECLLLDVMMPLARGLEVVRRVRQDEAWHPTIAMISARTRVTDRLNALEAGADLYIEKPFEPETLLSVIERRLAEAAPSRMVDVLGPIWTAMAIERLARAAVARRSATRIDPARVQGLFADLVARSVGRVPVSEIDPAGGSVGALRLIWEDTLRALLRDASDPPIPTVTGLTAPNAWEAVEQLIGNESLLRHRASLEGNRTRDPGRTEPAEVVLPGPAEIRSTGPGRGRDGGWSQVLRSVLSPADATEALTGRCRAAFDGILRADDAGRASNLDPLEELWLALIEHATVTQRVKESA